MGALGWGVDSEDGEVEDFSALCSFSLGRSSATVMLGVESFFPPFAFPFSSPSPSPSPLRLLSPS